MIKLSTGTEIKANADVVGIDDELEVYEGYDSGLMPAARREEWMDDNYAVLSPAEQIELGKIMVARWNRFIERATIDNIENHYPPYIWNEWTRRSPTK